MDDKYILLEQYRIYNEAKDRFIDRTFLVNRFYIVFSAVLFLSMIAIKSIFVDAYALLLGIELFGLAVCFSWVSNQDAYSSIIKIILLKDVQKWFAIILMLLFLGNGLLDITGFLLTSFLSVQ